MTIYPNTSNFKFHYVSINSTKKYDYKIKSNYFKFHYVSINSFSGLAFKLVSIVFKFHYVSINSEIPTVVKIAMCNTLNSIMFLLILTGAVLDGYAVCDFKFHYVSINSGIAMRR